MNRLHIDRPLFYALLLLAGVSLIVIYSATGKNEQMLVAHFVRLLIGFGILIGVAQLRPELLERVAPYIFAVAVVLTAAVLVTGSVSKGAQRWLGVGAVRFQPSEVLKLAVPMMLAWYLANDRMPPRLWHLAVATLIAIVPTVLIAKQPDLGTAILVFSAGMFVLFLAGMPARILVIAGGGLAAALPFLWHRMHDYQRNRILTLIDPGADPLGTGYHTIQSMIAIGSGGLYGKGWLNSSQAHLEYLPESWTDFIFAVLAEEFGLIGTLLVFGLYLFIIARALLIAFQAQDTFTRLLAGGLTMTFFVQFFVNIGMVSGILPVVGVPLPMMSYGGSSILTLMATFGVLTSIHTHRKIVEF